MSTLAPLIGVCADLKTINEQPFHVVGDKYLRALAKAGGCTPLIIPALADVLDLASLLQRLDGLFLTGSLSNVHPSHYGETASPLHEPYDTARDALTLRLIEQALSQQLPLFGVCRGFQELNVALGGTLHPALHTLPERLDHRRQQSPELDVQYGPQHTIRLRPDGQFRQILEKPEISVNSLHWQGIDRLAPGLEAEGWAPDGIIEAVRVKDARNFALAVQWHPEYKAAQNPDSVKLFQAFGAAAREYAAAR